MDGYQRREWLSIQRVKITQPGRSMTDSAKLRDRTDRRLERAARHVSELWIPANADFIKQFRDRLGTGEFGSDIERVIGELRKDVSGFLFCVGEISKQARASGVSADLLNPVDVIRWGGVERVRLALEQGDNQLTMHSLNRVSWLQEKRMSEVLTSAAAAEVLSGSYGIQAEQGYGSALIRQLGYMLVAFNYRDIYEEVMINIKPDESIELRLQEKLGFTPSTLALTLLREWGIVPASVGLSCDDEPVDPRLKAVEKTVAKMCEAGEALARANQPEVYPSASSDWEVARSQIEDKLGKRGLSLIRRALKSNTQQYLEQVPTMFKGGIVLDPEMQIARHWDVINLRRNPFLAGCAAGMRQQRSVIYDRLPSAKVSRDCLNAIVRDAVPQSGFDAGIIFTIELSSKMLVPQLKIGSVKGIEPVPVAFADKGRLVSRAYDSSQPEIHSFTIPGSPELLGIAGLVGFSQRVGVLYLEMPQSRFSEPGIDYLTHFKALAKAFTDTLNLA